MLSTSMAVDELSTTDFADEIKDGTQGHHVGKLTAMIAVRRVSLRGADGLKFRGTTGLDAYRAL